MDEYNCSANRLKSMSRERTKKEPHQGCDACDFQKLKQLENNPVIRNLRDKIEHLSFRLSECKNENQMLKRNLQLARKMVCQEVGGLKDVDFQALMKHGTDPGSKVRQENILVLKTKVLELKEYLRELEGAEPPKPKETPSEDYVRHQMPNDRKKLWRMELERRLARENAEKDINPLVQECCELRRNLDAEKSRYRELSEEVKLLRAELQSQVEKNEEDFGIVNSLKTLESQLKEILAERAEIRRDLNSARARNKRLNEDIGLLKEELDALQKKTNDNNALIDSLTSSHKSIQEAIDAEKVIVQQNVERYKRELKALHENHTTDGEIIDHLQCIVHDRNELINEISKDIDACVKKNNEKKEKKSNKQEKLSAKEPKIAPSSPSKNKLANDASVPDEQPEGQNEPTPEDNENARKLRLECLKYKVLSEAAKNEGECISRLIANQDKKMNEIAIQVVETGRLIMQKNAEKKEVFEKVNKLQRSLSAKRKRGKFHGQNRNKVDELRMKCEAQKEENDFLRNFLRSAVCDKAKDIQLLKEFIVESRNFLDTRLREIRESSAAETINHEGDTPLE